MEAAWQPGSTPEVPPEPSCRPVDAQLPPEDFPAVTLIRATPTVSTSKKQSHSALDAVVRKEVGSAEAMARIPDLDAQLVFPAALLDVDGRTALAMLSTGVAALPLLAAALPKD